MHISNNYALYGCMVAGIAVLIIALFVSIRGTIRLVRFNRKHREMQIANIRQNIVPKIASHEYSDNPAEIYGHLKITFRYCRIKEADIGISMNNLLGHVVVCQRDYVERCRDKLENKIFEIRLEGKNAPERKVTRLILASNEFIECDEAELQLKKLEQEWLLVQGMGVVRMDLPPNAGLATY